MAGKTITEKVVERAAGRAVTPGEFVNVEPDGLIMCEMYWPHVEEVMAEVGVNEPWDPGRIAIVIDHTTSLALDPPETPVHNRLRDYVQAHGLAESFYPVGRSGIRHQVAVEHGHVQPGGLIISDEPNMATFGALGAINQPIGWDIAEVFLTGSTWMRVPESWRVEVDGRFPDWVTSRDLALKLISDLGDGGALWKALEFSGPAIDAMSIDGRMNLLALAYLSSAETAVIQPDGKVTEFLERYPSRFDYELPSSDDDAIYERELHYDVARLRPQVAGPNSPSAGNDLESVVGTRIDQACIGSNSNGRIEDLRAAAHVLKGREVHPNVRFYITPISQQVYFQAIQEGLVETFVKAGASVLTPGCNTCFGYLGVLDDGEICITTHSASYAGRMGSEKADIYLANSMVVTASAIEGKIADPTSICDTIPDVAATAK